MIPSKYCDSPSKRALEICELNNMSSKPAMGGRQLSKSTSELSSPREFPDVRPSSAAPPEASHLSVYQKAHSFFAQIKNRWSHNKKDKRGFRKSVGSTNRQDSTDYAADLSSDHSSPSTQSPRHRLHTGRTESPLSRSYAGGGDTTSSPSGSPRPRAPTPGAAANPDLLPFATNDEVSRRRELALRQHSFFQLRVHLRRGSGLVAMDKNGLSDPYVKFKCGGRVAYKSRTVYRDLNPIWDESFTLPIEDPFVPIQLKVFDYDWGLQDDFMGSAVLDLTAIDLGRPTDIVLPLQDPERPNDTLGEVALTATLYPKTQEDKELCTMEKGHIHILKKKILQEIIENVPRAETQNTPLWCLKCNVKHIDEISCSKSPEETSTIKEGEHMSRFEIQMEKFNDRLKVQGEKIHRYFQKNSKISDVNRRLKSQIWSSVVTIVLVEARNLLACDTETATSDPYVKFRLGNEKYKSKTVWRSLNPRWLEQFDLHLYDDGDQQLEITVWDKDSRTRDDFMGRCVIDLSALDREITHSLWHDLEDGAGSLHILLTISGTTASETISDLTTYEENPKEKELIQARYELQRTLHNVKDVGHLTVKVFRATGLAAADIGGKSDPFCVLELGNARLQTQTEYKTLTPSWQKIFTFNVKDINNVLEVTVFDEDRDHKVEFLGKVAIPLLRIRSGEKRWYALKDKKLRNRAKGNCPQILLEMHLAWNPVRAFIRTLNPREEKYMQTEMKFKRQVFVKNVLRLKVFILYFYEVGKVFQNCFEWESRIQSFAALNVWLILCYYFQPWMLPVALLLIFLKEYIVKVLAGPTSVPWDEVVDSDIDEDDDEDKEKEEKKSLKERLQAIQEVTQSVQNAIGKIVSLLEAVKNIFNFTVPYLSWIAITLLVAGTVVLYFIPIRYLLMLWGTNKFFRRILRPHAVPNNEVLDLLSRVPDDEMLLDYKDLQINLNADGEKRTNLKKKHKTS